MLNKALDLLRTLGWAIVDFIYSLIDSLFDILKEINALDIVNSISNESMFRRLYSGIFAIAITVLGLFAIWNFIKKIIDPDDGLTVEKIVKEIIKCGFLIIMSTFLFVQSSNLSINLSGYTASVFTSNDMTLADNMLVEYISYTDAYKESDDFKNEDIKKYIKNDNFTNKKMYNDFINICKDKSLYQTGIKIKDKEKLITLSTCEYSNKNSRLVIVARKIK